MASVPAKIVTLRVFGLPVALLAFLVTYVRVLYNAVDRSASLPAASAIREPTTAPTALSATLSADIVVLVIGFQMK